ncbi:MAG: uroporphyrinogen-III C-methyltransferase [Planctomycetes bacterium]|nr:uroporphyrinogen-III C-methyltransferase [Planctomycetota bacterium]
MRSPGKVFLVGAGPGAADLITVRGRRILESADVVLFDALVEPGMLDGVTALAIDVGKRCGRHSMSQEEIVEILVEHARAGKVVVRLKGGDPNVLGRGGEEALALAAAGVPCEIVPGVTSAVAAPELAGIPLTHRDLADAFTVASAHPRQGEDGFSFPPYHPRNTLVLLMGVSTVPRWREELEDRGYPRDLPVAFIVDASRETERVVVTTLARAAQDAASGGVHSPAVAVIGRVVSLRTILQGEGVDPPRNPALDGQRLGCYTHRSP